MQQAIFQNTRAITLSVTLGMVLFSGASTAVDGVTYLIASRLQSDTLVRLVDGSPVESMSLGTSAVFGVGDGILATAAWHPQEDWQVSLTIWDYESGERRNEFVLDTYPWGSALARPGLVVTQDTVWFAGFNPVEPAQYWYVLGECRINTETCQSMAFPRGITRAFGAQATRFRNGVLICAPELPTDVLIYEAGAFSELPPEWVRSTPNAQPRMNSEIRLSYQQPLLACVATRNGFAHVSNTGDIEVNVEGEKWRFDLAARAEQAGQTVDRWLYPQTRLVEDKELLYLGEAVYDSPNNRDVGDIEAIVAVDTSDGAEAIRIPLPGRVSEFQVFRNGDIRFVDLDTLTVSDYIAASGSVRLVTQFRPDEAARVVLVPQL